MSADGPEEDWRLLVNCGMVDPVALLGVYGDGPLRELCVETQRAVDMNVVNDYCDLFRAIASQRNSRKPALWICKDPIMPMYMKTWLATFDVMGDAKKFIWLHRDPFTSVASLMSLGRSVQSFLFEYSDYEACAQTMIEALADGMCQLMRFRDSLSPPVQQETFLDVAFDDIQRHPIETLQKIYDFVGLEFDDVAKAHAQAYLDANPKEASKHIYDGAEFGLSQQLVNEKFQFYIDRFQKFT